MEYATFGTDSSSKEKNIGNTISVKDFGHTETELIKRWVSPLTAEGKNVATSYRFPIICVGEIPASMTIPRDTGTMPSHRVTIGRETAGDREGVSKHIARAV